MSSVHHTKHKGVLFLGFKNHTFWNDESKLISFKESGWPFEQMWFRKLKNPMYRSPQQLSYPKLCYIPSYAILNGVQKNPSQTIFFPIDALNMNPQVERLELVSKELNHFGVIADLFRQIGVHSSRFMLFCSFWNG